MERIASVPGLPPILACAALLAIWEIAARLLAIDGLPPASAALAQVPAILGDPEALLDIRRVVAAHGRRLCPGHRGRGADRPDDGAQPIRRSLLQSAADDHLPRAEGGADAHRHAVARGGTRRRRW